LGRRLPIVVPRIAPPPPPVGVSFFAFPFHWNLYPTIKSLTLHVSHMSQPVGVLAVFLETVPLSCKKTPFFPPLFKPITIFFRRSMRCWSHNSRPHHNGGFVQRPLSPFNLNLFAPFSLRKTLQLWPLGLATVFPLTTVT